MAAPAVRVRDITGRLGYVEPAMVDLTNPTPATVPVRFGGLTGYVMTKPQLLVVVR